MKRTRDKMHQQFNDILEQSKIDKNVIGLVLTGSRGKEFENENSDYDVWMITKDKSSTKKLREKYSTGLIDIDLSVASLSDFDRYAFWSGPDAWDRYDFTHCKILADKTGGELRRIVDQKGKIPKREIGSYIRSNLDSYINQVFRSVRCHRDGEYFGAHLEANMGIAPMLDALYALEGRPRPFFKYLEKELEYFPLKYFPWKNQEFLKKVSAVLSKGDLKSQQDLLRSLEKIFRKAGYGKIFDGWEGKDKWAMKFKKS